MAFQSRTGKLIQGLLGRFGKKHPEPPAAPAANPRYHSTRSETEIDEREFPSPNRFDDDEETNWDDAETLADQNSPIVYAQPIESVIIPPPVNTTPDLEEWDEALPAATVKNSNIQEVRRGKKPVLIPPTVDNWGDDLPSRTFSPSSNPNLAGSPSRFEQLIGLWAAILQQFRRFLPAPIRRLSDVLLTAILVMSITVSIWFVDGFFTPGIDPSVASQPAAQPESALITKTSPEQVLIEAIQTQLSDITSQYPDDLIQSLQVDIAHDRLIVQLNPSWYLISDDKQNRITDRMWLQAKVNHFSKIEIQATDGSSIARSPVVGKQMIILQRRQTAS